MARHFSHINPFLSTQQLNEVDAIIIPILQRRTLRPREVTFVQGHTVNGGAKTQTQILGSQSVCVCERVLSLFSYVRLCVTPRDCNWPGSSVHGTSQARILEWVAIPSSRGSSRPRDRTRVSLPALAGKFFTTSTPWEARPSVYYTSINSIYMTQLASRVLVISKLFSLPAGWGDAAWALEGSRRPDPPCLPTAP